MIQCTGITQIIVMGCELTSWLLNANTLPYPLLLQKHTNMYMFKATSPVLIRGISHTSK